MRLEQQSLGLSMQSFWHTRPTGQLAVYKVRRFFNSLSSVLQAFCYQTTTAADVKKSQVASGKGDEPEMNLSRALDLSVPCYASFANTASPLFSDLQTQNKYFGLQSEPRNQVSVIRSRNSGLKQLALQATRRQRSSYRGAEGGSSQDLMRESYSQSAQDPSVVAST